MCCDTTDDITETFAESMPNYEKMSKVMKTLSGRDIDRHAMRSETTSGLDQLATIDDLTDYQLMLTPPSLHGFSLSDKEWCAYFR
jgi:hypothetical protein